MKTRVTMEEKYATLSVAYATLSKKEELLESLNKSIKKFNLTPDIMVRPDSQTEPGKGRIIVEFRFNNREVGEFFEYLIKENKLIC